MDIKSLRKALLKLDLQIIFNFIMWKLFKRKKRENSLIILLTVKDSIRMMYILQEEIKRNAMAEDIRKRTLSELNRFPSGGIIVPQNKCMGDIVELPEMKLKPGEITFNNRPEMILLDGNKIAEQINITINDN